MKKDILKRFDEYCGVVKIIDEKTKEIVYIVYGFFMTGDPEPYELGDALGKGKTVEEALIDAVKNSVQIRKETEDAIQEFMDNSYIKLYSPAGRKEKIVHPMTVDYDDDKKTANANLYYNEKQKTIYIADL